MVDGVSRLKRSKLILPLIFITGLLLRTYRLPTSYYYAGDSGLFDLAVINWLKLKGVFPLVGPVGSTGDLHFGPFYYYLIAPGLWLFNWHPLGSVLTVLILNMGAAILGYFLLKRHATRIAALLFAGLYMASAFSISLSRGSWNPNPLSFFTVLLLFGLIEFIKTKRLWAIFVAGLAIGCGIQLHYAVLAEVPILLLILGLYSREDLKDWRVWASLAAGLIMPLIPFLVGQAQSGWIDFVALWNNLTGPHVSKSTSLVLNVKRFFLPFELYFPSKSLPLIVKGFAMAAWIAFIGYAALATQAKRKESGEEVLFGVVLIFFFLAFLATVAQKIDLYPHYYYFYDILAPIIICLVIGNILTKENRSKIKVAAAMVAYALLLAWSVVGIPGIYQTDRPVAVEQAAGIIASNYYGTAREDSGAPVYVQVVSPVTTDGGYEYRTFLERNNIHTFSGFSKDSPSYILIESRNRDAVPLNPSWFTGAYTPKLIGLTKAEGVIDTKSIGYIKIYRVTKR